MSVKRNKSSTIVYDHVINLLVPNASVPSDIAGTYCDDRINLHSPEMIPPYTICVPQNGYEIVSGQTTLMTAGFSPCVILILYHPRFGRYLAHIYQDNPFYSFPSTANDRVTSSSGHIPNGKTVADSLPSWIRSRRTRIVLFNTGPYQHLLYRAKQLQAIRVHTIYAYMNTPMINRIIEESDTSEVDNINYYDDASEEYQAIIERERPGVIAREKQTLRPYHQQLYSKLQRGCSLDFRSIAISPSGFIYVPLSSRYVPWFNANVNVLTSLQPNNDILIQAGIDL